MVDLAQMGGVSAVSAIAGGVGTYWVLKYRVAKLEEAVKTLGNKVINDYQKKEICDFCRAVANDKMNSTNKCVGDIKAKMEAIRDKYAVFDRQLITLSSDIEHMKEKVDAIYNLIERRSKSREE